MPEKPVTTDTHQPRRKYGKYAIEALALIAIFTAITTYQSRNLLPTEDQLAPALSANTLQGARYDLTTIKNRPVLIYFFAPWCPYCSASASNLVRLREWRDTESLEILIVALDWESAEQIQTYADEHELNVPVLLGDSQVARDWKIVGFPTYYVLDSEHQVVSRDFGYSTQLGLWWRSWFAG